MLCIVKIKHLPNRNHDNSSVENYRVSVVNSFTGQQVGMSKGFHLYSTAYTWANGILTGLDINEPGSFIAEE